MLSTALNKLPTPPITSVTDIKMISALTSSEYGVMRANRITANIVARDMRSLRPIELKMSLYVSSGFFCPSAVSYTHLRAHETDSYLVCRLLLEKKKIQDLH